MARPNKTGINYFPFDIDFFNDEKIEFTSARFGVKGEIITIRLLCKIYRNGYYTEWNNDESTILAKRAGDGITPSLVSEIVKELVKRGFFDETLLNRFDILTSKGIQSRYFEAVKRYKSVDVIEDFLLVDVSEMDNVNTNSINAYINYENDYTNQQKKIKEKETKQKEINDEKPTRFSPPTLEEVKDYCFERKNNVDAQRFFDFYQSKGWMVGRNKMKDWKACVRTWEQQDSKKTIKHPAASYNPNPNEEQDERF